MEASLLFFTAFIILAAGMITSDHAERPCPWLQAF